jgi:AraC family transcriptional regulator
MKRKKMMNEYIYRINKVLNYIQENIDGDLSLDNLSKIASFSPYHFHRLFKKIVGENVNNFVKRERIERAAKMLVANYEDSLTGIALNSGYSSTSVFSRTFKEHFGISASEYRKEYRKSNICKLKSKHEKAISRFFDYDHNYQTAADLIQMKGSNNMNIQVKSIQGFRVAYVRLQGYDAGVFSRKIESAFNKVRRWMNARELFDQNTKHIGIFYDHSNITSNESRRYDASFTVPQHIQSGSDGVDIQDIPEGKYAICRVEADHCDEESWSTVLSKLDQALQFIMEEWIQENGFQLEDKPCMEIYLSTSPNIIMEAYVPIKPK